MLHILNPDKELRVMRYLYCQPKSKMKGHLLAKLPVSHSWRHSPNAPVS